MSRSSRPCEAADIVRIGRAEQILLLLTPPIDVQQSLANSYWSWVEERVLTPIQEQFPEVYEWLVKRFRSLVAEMADVELSEGDDA